MNYPEKLALEGYGALNLCVDRVHLWPGGALERQLPLGFEVGGGKKSLGCRCSEKSHLACQFPDTMTAYEEKKIKL